MGNINSVNGMVSPKVPEADRFSNVQRRFGPSETLSLPLTFKCSTGLYEFLTHQTGL